jgi:hypothetical protein
MDTVWTMLKVLGAVVILAQPIVGFIIIRRMQRKHGDLPSMPVEDLRALAEKSPFLHCNKVLGELSRRNEDISFALPVLFSLAVDDKMVVQLIGWGGLSTYFSDKFPNLDFSKNRPTRAERDWILSQLDYMKTEEIT